MKRFPAPRGHSASAPANPDFRKPVIWTVSVTRLSELLRDVTPEFDGRARIEPINLGFEEAVRHIRDRLAHEHCDVLIAAGSNGGYLKGRIGRPVVLVKPSGFDLMQSLTRARRLAPRVGVVTHETELPAFAEFQTSFGLKIDQRTFVTIEDARNCVAELAARGCKAIVGTGMVCDLAEQSGVAGILLYSAESIREAFENALDIARMIDGSDIEGAPLRRPPQRRSAGPHKYGLRNLQGTSPAMQQLRELVLRYGASDRTVLLTGATGTGKELVAHALHAASPRRGGPLVAVNCGAIAESLLESELFGYEEGAFTGSRRGGRTGLIEAADGGSLLLDEIGEMPLTLQTRLLRVLEEREVVRVGSSRPIPVDIRIIAATHCDLEAMVAQGQFRRDLYYRLNVLRLRLPELCERPEDVPLLAQAFLDQALGAAAPQLAPEAAEWLRAQRWMGNVRELRNLIDRLTVQASAAELTAPVSALLLRRCAPELDAANAFSPPPALSPPGSSEILPGASNDTKPAARPDAATLHRLLLQSGGDRQLLARQLGVSRTTLWRWLREIPESTPVA